MPQGSVRRSRNSRTPASRSTRQATRKARNARPLGTPLGGLARSLGLRVLINAQFAASLHGAGRPYHGGWGLPASAATGSPIGWLTPSFFGQPAKCEGAHTSLPNRPLTSDDYRSGARRGH